MLASLLPSLESKDAGSGGSGARTDLKRGASFPARHHNLSINKPASGQASKMEA